MVVINNSFFENNPKKNFLLWKSSKRLFSDKTEMFFIFNFWGVFIDKPITMVYFKLTYTL